jgi:hypothetical protein
VVQEVTTLEIRRLLAIVTGLLVLSAPWPAQVIWLVAVFITIRIFRGEGDDGVYRDPNGEGLS